jgi:hypothetical protein
MRRVRALLLKVACFFLGPRKDEGFSAELATHLQMHTDENVHSGMSPQEARRPHQVLRLMLRQGITLAMGGVILGAIFSFALMGFLRSLVFGVTITDPMTFLAASAILTAAAVLACWVPSRRVIRMDPMIALRHE